MQNFPLRISVSVLLALLVRLATAQEIVKDFPPGPVRDSMIRMATTFNSGSKDLAIESILFKGFVEKPEAIAEEMLKTSAIIGTDAENRTTVFDYEQLSTVDPKEMARFLESMKLNLAKGDMLIWVALRDLHRKKRFDSLNSMSPDGRMFSGSLFSTARLPSGFTTRVSRPNTVCSRQVLTTYLWGSPAETAEGCVRATCNGAKCTDCVITTSNAFGGFFAKAEIVPGAGTPGRVVQSESKSCCDGYFQWAWATGFKSIKVDVKKISIAIEGHIGQSGNGSFTVSECCPQ